MAKLFLSYSRKDDAKARRFNAWLESEGHDVWRDEDDIGGGSTFSSEIESALGECAAVVVLWSANSIKSTWVRDEAGFGRDAGKLIPFSLDGTDPPLGFRQFHSINLSSWKGQREPPDPDRIRRALGRVAGLGQPAPLARAAASQWLDLGSRKRLLAGGALLLLTAVLVVFLLWL